MDHVPTAEFDRLKAKVVAGDDLDEKWYFIQRASGADIGQHAPGLITRLQAESTISADEAAGLFRRLLSAAAVPSAAPAADEPAGPAAPAGLWRASGHA